MKTVKQSFTIELTTEEIEVITTALHGEYKFVKDLRTKAEQDQQPRLYQKQKTVQRLRNDFAELVGQRFMGEDA